MSNWIRIKDRLPEEKQQVLTYGLKIPNIHDLGLPMITAIYAKGEFESDHFCESSWVGNVTHWQPLPEAPK